MLVALAEHLGLNRIGVRQALLLGFASWAAFAVASLLHISNAYWAAMPVWVIFQTTRGLMIMRGLGRVAGTIIGAAFGFAILHVVADPYIQLFGLALWVGCTATLTHVLPGVAAYGALMTGMTAAVVVLPVVLSSEPTWDLAMARVECSLIGVIIATVLVGFAVPDAKRAAFYMRARQMAGDAVAYVMLILRGAPDKECRKLEHGIFAGMSEITQTWGVVTAGSFRARRRLEHVGALVVASLSVMAAGRALQVRGNTRKYEPTAEELKRLSDRWRQIGPQDGHEPVTENIGDPRLAAALADLIAAEESLRTGSSNGRVSNLSTDRNWYIGLRIGLVSGTVTWLASVTAHAVPWPSGELAALGVCIFSMVLGSMPMPQLIAPHMLKGATAGVLAALLYRFGLQPHVHTLPELLASIAPFLLVGGFARVSPHTAKPAIDANMCFLLASQAVLPAVTDPFVILSEAAALMLAAIVTTTGFILIPRRPAREAARTLTAIRRDLERLAAGRSAGGGEHWDLGVTRQILRLTLHVSRAGDDIAQRPSGLLDVINLGHAII